MELSQVLTRVGDSTNATWHVVRFIRDLPNDPVVEVTNETGTRAVLRRVEPDVVADDIRHSEAHLVRLAKRGYSYPGLLALVEASGRVWTVRRFLEGSKVPALTVPIATELLGMIEMQANASLGSGRNWSEIVKAVLDDEHQGSWRRALADHSPATRKVLRRVDRLVSRIRTINLGTADVVHGDFHPENVILVSAGYPAVVDVDSVGIGNRAFDIASLLWAAYDCEADRRVVTAIRDRLYEISEQREIETLVAYQVLSSVAWGIGHDGPEWPLQWVDAALDDVEHASASSHLED